MVRLSDPNNTFPPGTAPPHPFFFYLVILWLFFIIIILMDSNFSKKILLAWAIFFNVAAERDNKLRRRRVWQKL